jgi:predicted nucleic acid-binding protein
MLLVLDASVCLKWFLSEPTPEPDSAIAFALLEDIRNDTIRLLQPPVWHSEIAAVLARMQPKLGQQMIEEVFRLNTEIDASEIVLNKAISLASQLDHHLFDTIYHALAIERETTLITADARYYRKAQALGHIALLGQWRSSKVGETAEKYTARASKRRSARPKRGALPASWP